MRRLGVYAGRIVYVIVIIILQLNFVLDDEHLDYEASCNDPCTEITTEPRTTTPTGLEDQNSRLSTTHDVERYDMGSPVDEGEGSRGTKKGLNEVRFSTEAVIASETRETIVAAADDVAANSLTKRDNTSPSSTHPVASAAQQTTSPSTPCDITRGTVKNAARS